MHEHVNVHILLLWDYVHSSVVKKCLVRIEESVLLQVVVQAHSLVCNNLNCTKKKIFFLLWCGKVGGVVWRGRVGEMVHVSGVGVCMGFQRGAGLIEFRALTAWGKKAVEQSGGAGSDAPVPSS